MIFLDTNIISYYLEGNEIVTSELMNYFEDDVQLCISVINVYEVLKGFRWKNKTHLENKFNLFLKYAKIFTIDETVINVAATIYADLRRKGINIGDADILIAAIVISNNGILVTNNIKHFENISQLRIMNWLKQY